MGIAIFNRTYITKRMNGFNFLTIKYITCKIHLNRLILLYNFIITLKEHAKQKKHYQTFSKISFNACFPSLLRKKNY
jgi:hypothetical protein